MRRSRKRKQNFVPNDSGEDLNSTEVATTRSHLATATPTRTNRDSSFHSGRSARKRRRTLLSNQHLEFTEHSDRNQFSKGNVVRVFVENFVSHSRLQFFPSPGLNVILGTNGAGKSALMSAVLLTLGAKAKHLDRGSDMSSYIMRDKNYAISEIELYRAGDNGKNVVIRRKLFRKQGSESSTWEVDGKTCEPSYVRELVRSLGIYVENLFQFVPQLSLSKFQSFSESNLLREFEAVFENGATMVAKHDRMIALQETFQALDMNLEKHRGKSNDLQRAIREAKQDKLRYEKRQKHVQEYDKLKQKKPWVEFWNCEKKITGIKGEIASLEGSRDKIAVELKKIKDEIEKNGKERNKLFALERKTRRDRDSATISVQRKLTKLSEWEYSIQLNQKSIEEIDHEILRDEAELAKMKQDMASVEHSLAQFEGTKDIEARNEELSTEMRRYNHETVDIQMKKERYLTKQLDLDNQVRMVQQLRDAKMNIEKRRFDLICENNPEFLRVRQEIERMDFSSEVYFPVACHIRLKSKEYGHVLERCIGHTRSSIICCNNGDYFKLMNMFSRRRNLRMDIFVVRESREPTRLLPDSMKRDFGIEYWLDEIFDAPAIVKQAVMLKHNIDKIACVNRKMKSSEDFYRRGVTRFYSEGVFHDTFRSKYSGDISDSINNVFPAKIFRDAVDMREVRKFDQQLIELDGEKKRITSEIKNFTMQNIEIAKHIERIRKEKNRNARKIGERSSIEAKLKVLKMKIGASRGGSSAQEKVRMIKDNKKRNNDRYELSDGLVNDVKAGTKFRCELADLAIQLDAIDRKAIKLEPVLSTASAEHRRECKRIQNETENRNFMQAECDKLKEVAVKTVELTQELREMFTDLPDELEQLEERIHQEKLCIKELSVHGRKNSLEEYEKQVEEFNSLKDRIADLEKERAEIERSVKKVKKEWGDMLIPHIKTLSEHFAESFKAIGLAGDIQLDREKRDFKSYGLAVFAKFRNNEPLRRINTSSMSGGERALCVALMVNSLQKLRRVPLMMFDEINQGMDEENESFMISCFETANENREEDHSTQTFIVSPKLSPKINFNDSTTIHFLINSSSLSY